jgi:hypothetical protein
VADLLAGSLDCAVGIGQAGPVEEAQRCVSVRGRDIEYIAVAGVNGVALLDGFSELRRGTDDHAPKGLAAGVY